jgi:hypothetical protein
MGRGKCLMAIPFGLKKREKYGGVGKVKWSSWQFSVFTQLFTYFAGY